MTVTFNIEILHHSLKQAVKIQYHHQFCVTNKLKMASDFHPACHLLVPRLPSPELVVALITFDIDPKTLTSSAHRHLAP